MNIDVIPKVIYSHIATHNIKQLEPAWIQLKSNSEVILAVGGAWQHYFQTLPPINSHITNSCEALYGMLPMFEGFELPQVQMIQNHYTDISGIHHKDHDWLLFCDVTQHTLQLQQYQQASNELVLLKGKLNQTLDRYVGHEVSTRIATGGLQLDAAGERRRISTLFVDIRGFTPFNELHDAQTVMLTLNDYMDCMLSPILDEAGMIDKIIGDGAMAIFGVLPSQYNSAEHAFLAATQALNRTKKLNLQRKNQGLEQLGIGFGIATGDAVLGILGSHERRSFTAIGRHVNLAARLESQARISEILIDLETYQCLNKNMDFSPVTLSLKGIGKVDVFSCIVPCTSS